MKKNNFLKTECCQTDATDLDDSNKKKRKIFRRSFAQLDKSHQSKSSIKIQKLNETAVQFKPKYVRSFIHSGLSSIQEKNHAPKRAETPRANLQTLRSTTFIKNICGQINTDKPQIDLKNNRDNCISQINSSIFKKIDYLSEQLTIRNQEIDVIQVQRSKLKHQYKQLEFKYNNLQQRNKKVQKELEKVKQDIRILVNSKRLWQSEKTTLAKRIQTLQNLKFNSQTKNLQSFRQLHLQKQLQQFKQKLNKNKTQVQQLLETQLNSLKQQVFNYRKIIQSLQINNKCLHMKLKQKLSQINTTLEYNALRSKYRKFLLEFRDLRKNHEILQKQHAKLQSHFECKVDEDISLQFSML